ncbi:MAG: carbohydrate-binding protein [Cytophagaceae bacterium]|jgi:photosystem II stability/assembly factor-like uncharacterized protein|nr:carbohydrate-binding protein [Cytophagaceae bacterium]
MKHLFKTHLWGYYFVLIFSIQTSYAQRFIQLMNDPNVSFDQVKKEADAHFKLNGTGKGQGYKVYKRWEHEKLLSQKPDGSFQSKEEFLKECDKLPKKSNGAKNAKVGNVYRELGPKGFTVTSGYAPGMGRITSICVDPQNANTIYAAGTGGVWKTTNNSTSWTPLTDHLAAVYSNAVAVQPGNSNVVIIGIKDQGIMKSTNGGSTFVATNITFGDPYKIIFHPNTPTIVLVASSTGLYRSTDAGSTFTQIISGLFNDVDFKPGDPSTVYTCGNSFFRSIDTGLNFTQITAGISTFGRSFLAVSPANAAYVYLVQAEGGALGYIYRSTNSGLTFQTRLDADPLNGTNYLNGNPSLFGGQANYDLAITMSPTDAETILIGGINIWKSTNGGTSFFQQTEWTYGNAIGYVHPDIHALEWVNGIIYTGSDGGIFRSANGGDDWTDMSKGIGNREFYRIGGIESDPYYIGGGSQDNGQSLLLTNDVNNWREWFGADGMEVVIDYNNKNNIYACVQNGEVWKSNDGGMSYIKGGVPPGTGDWNTPLLMDPVNPSTLYIAYEDMWKSTDGANTWVKISNVSDGFSDMKAAAIAPSNNQVMYMGRQNQMWVTRNGGTNWTNISAGLFDNINYISIHPTDPNRVVVSTNFTIFQTSNGGQSWNVISYNLPYIQKRCVLYQRGPEDIIYVGLQVGVFYLRPNTTTWVEYYDGLPNVPVSELDINYSINRLRVATYGRGLWEAPLIRNANTLPTVSITAPTNGSSYTSPAAITINASASDADGTITRVEFFNGATKLGEDLTVPYSFVWNISTSGTYQLTAIATDNAGGTRTSTAVAVTVSSGATQTPYGGIAAAIPGTIRISNYDLGGQNIAYFDGTAGNSGGSYRTDDVDLQACSEGGFNVAWVAASEWLEYTVNVSQTGSYNCSLRVATPMAARTLRLYLNNNPITASITAPNTGGWQSWQTLVVPNISLTQGTSVMRVTFETGDINMSYLTFSANATSQTPYGGIVKAIPGKIEAEEYDLGGQTIAFNDLTTGNSGGAFRTDAVDIENCSEGTFNIAYTGAGEWLEYTANVSATGVYTIQFRVATPIAGRQIRLDVDGTPVSGTVTIPATGGWQSWQTVSVPNISLTTGTKVLRLNFLTSDVNVNFIQFVRNTSIRDASEAEQSTIQQILIFPNPVSDVLQITGKKGSDSEIEIQVLNALGEVLLRQTAQAPEGIFNSNLSCKGLDEGVYFIKIISGKEFKIEKFIKQ